jgi:hypothetical protein
MRVGAAPRRQPTHQRRGRPAARPACGAPCWPRAHWTSPRSARSGSATCGCRPGGDQRGATPGLAVARRGRGRRGPDGAATPPVADRRRARGVGGGAPGPHPPGHRGRLHPVCGGLDLAPPEPGRDLAGPPVIARRHGPAAHRRLGACVHAGGGASEHEGEHDVPRGR